MIASRRRAHLRLVAVVCMVLPLALAAGHAVRRGPDPVVTLPTALAMVEVPRGARLAWERDDLWADAEHVVRLYVGDGDGERLLELTARAPTALPDLLLYWLPPGAAPDVQAPGEGSYPLGSLPGPGVHRYRLPPGVEVEGARLLLYSLAHDEGLAASAALPANEEAER